MSTENGTYPGTTYPTSHPTTGGSAPPPSGNSKGMPSPDGNGATPAGLVPVSAGQGQGLFALERQPEPRREIEARTAALEDEMEAHRRRGVLGLVRLRYEAWLEGKMQGPAIRKMQARQAVLFEQCRTAEAEIRLKATVQSGEVGTQRHRIEWNEVNRQRLAGELQGLGMITLAPAPAALSSSPPVPPPVSPHVTDEQVEAVALRAMLQGVETEEDWLAFKQELSEHLAPYAVEEVGSRLRQLWRVRGGTQGQAHW